MQGRERSPRRGAAPPAGTCVLTSQKVYSKHLQRCDNGREQGATGACRAVSRGARAGRGTAETTQCLSSFPEAKQSSPGVLGMRGDRLFTPGNRERCNSFFLLKEIEVSEILQHQQELYVPRVVSPQRLPPARLGSGTAPHACSTRSIRSAPTARAGLQPPTSSNANYWLVFFWSYFTPKVSRACPGACNTELEGLCSCPDFGSCSSPQAQEPSCGHQDISL